MSGDQLTIVEPEAEDPSLHSKRFCGVLCVSRFLAARKLKREPKQWRSRQPRSQAFSLAGDGAGKVPGNKVEEQELSPPLPSGFSLSLQFPRDQKRDSTHKTPPKPFAMH